MEKFEFQKKHNDKYKQKYIEVKKKEKNEITKPPPGLGNGDPPSYPWWCPFRAYLEMLLNDLKSNRHRSDMEVDLSFSPGDVSLKRYFFELV